MKVTYPLFSQVALDEDIPELHLKLGDVATVVEHYPMPDGEEDGYSLEGFDVPNVTVEVAASQIVPLNQWHHEAAILAKLRQLSHTRQLQLEEYLDFLLQKEARAEKKTGLSASCSNCWLQQPFSLLRTRSHGR